ncbi:MAG TPA: phosphatase PAP2 family protein [Chitinophagales bacterium]|nr:phosphatase PAP2 family protein [Chitinophagales bacterium]
MKTTITIFCCASLIAFLASCKKDIEPGRSFDSYTYASTDAGGGNWKTIYLTSATQSPLDAPTDILSSEYLAELASLKSISANLTSDQKEKIDYWSTNGVIRWNEITSELIAKYFLLSSPDSGDVYLFPNGTDPGSYPKVPFASPPFSCRALAYLSAGSFDALVAAWHYKYQYNRMAPSTYDASIATHLPVIADLPSYPSEDAVIAGFSRAFLKSMFPLEAGYLTQLAKDQEDSRLYAGTNVQSDIDAGDSLGAHIAAIFIGRAKGDGMKNTLGNVAQWDSITNYWASTGKPIWKSLEIPARQPLAVNFGHVKPWTFDANLVTTYFRLPPPPEVGSAEFETSINQVLDYSKHATRDEQAIAFKWDDGTSTYSPPGHWNAIAIPYIHDAQLNPLRAARVLAYMNMAVEDAGICVWDNKFYYYFPRPTNVNPDIKTIMGVPNFPSYPSGHSGFSAAAATVLAHFFPADANQFLDLAHEAANSRMYGCIHYSFDCDQGFTLGQNVAQYSLDLAIADGGE